MIFDTHPGARYFICTTGFISISVHVSFTALIILTQMCVQNECIVELLYGNHFKIKCLPYPSTILSSLV